MEVLGIEAEVASSMLDFAARKTKRNAMGRIRLLSLINALAFFLVAGLFTGTGYTSDRKVSVAVHQNPPIVYKDEVRELLRDVI